MAWVEVHQSLRDHRKVLTIADELALPEPHVAGHLVFLWLWALDNAPDGSLPASARLIERASGWNGEPGAFMQALIAAGLLEHDGDNLRIHDWDDYAGKLIDQRHANADRQRRHRERVKAVMSDLPTAHITGTSPLRNPATVPNPTVPNPTQPDHTEPNHERRPVAAAPVAAAAAPQPEPPIPVEAIQQPRTVAVPKPNRYGQVLDALKERGINYPGGRRDAGEVAKCSAAPALIADAYATFEEWAGDFGMSNKSLWYVCQRIAAYQAWQDGKRARASPNGRAGGLTVQQLLRGEG
jgi:hypothetical protein